MPPVKTIFRKPFFILLFPVFFVLHGYTVNYNAVPLSNALVLLLEYIVATLFFSFVFWLLYRDITKASLMTVALMLFYFFFGNVIDLLRGELGNSFFLRYRFLCFISLLLFLLLFILIKRAKPFKKLMLYLNILFLLLIVVDLMSLIIKIPKENQKIAFDPVKEGFTICDSCRKPDIYLIIPDEYPGSIALKEDFHFGNFSFEKELADRGFHIVPKSRSNYNSTPFSVASTLNLGFLNLPRTQQDFSTVQYCYDLIRHSLVLKFLNASGYHFINCSIFDFAGQPANEYSEFLPYGIKLVTAQTFADRMFNDLRQDIIHGQFGLRKLREKFIFQNLHFNDGMLERTAKIAAEKSGGPKFVYTHLMMPHSPFYFDSKGNRQPVEKIAAGNERWNKNDFIEYVQYTSRKLIWLVDQILSSSPSPPVIMILSDHGFRYEDKNFHPANEFMNLNAVYFPDKNYKEVYDSITNVNEFRVIFNKYFDQQLPILRDTIINLR